MKQGITLFFLILFVCTAAPFSAQGETELRGALFDTLRANGNPYYVFDDTVYVPAHRTLVIEPGVEIFFESGYGLWVNGNLQVQGEPGDSVVFRPLNAGIPGAWRGITLSTITAANSVINCASIMYGEKNVVFHETQARITNSHIHGAEDNNISIISGRPIIQGCYITNRYGSVEGHSISGNGSDAQIIDCVLSGGWGGEDGIYFTNRASPVIQGTLIKEFEGNGIRLVNCTNATIRENVIMDAMLRGIYMDDCGYSTLTRNIVAWTRSSGIFLDASRSIQLIQNTIYNAGANEVDLRDGIYIGARSTNPTLCGNIIQGASGFAVRSPTIRVASNYSCYYDNNYGVYYGEVYDGEGNLEAEPLLRTDVVIEGPDYLRIRSNSPCVDACICGEVDDDGTVGDMGARFYNQNQAPVVDSRSPQSLTLEGYEWGDFVHFIVEAHDPEAYDLEYRWYFRGGMISDSNISGVYVFSGDSLYVEIDDGFYGGITKVIWRFSSLDAPESAGTGIPEKFAVRNLHPNPFNSMTEMDIAIPRAGMLHVNVYDILGREVHTMKQAVQPGLYPYSLYGHSWASGIYFLQVRYEQEQHISKITLVK